MEESVIETKANSLRNKINQNKSLLGSLKSSLANITDALITTFPEYDYSYLEEKLSNLRIVRKDTFEYAIYDNNSNILTINADKVFDDGIDITHLFLQKMLSIATHKEEKKEQFKQFNDGIGTSLAITVLGDEGYKKNNILEYLSISLLSKVVDAKVLIDSYMKDDISLIIENLSNYGISEDEFKMLLHDMTNLYDESIQNNQSFANIQRRISFMFKEKLCSEIESNHLSKEDIDQEFFDFSGHIVSSRAELISTYPGYNFNKITGLEWSKTTLEELKNEVYRKLDKTDEQTLKQI